MREEWAGFHMEPQLLITKPEKKAWVLFDSNRGLERNAQGRFVSLFVIYQTEDFYSSSIREDLIF